MDTYEVENIKKEKKNRARKSWEKFFPILLSGIFLWFCPQAWGADWKYLGETPDASYYYNAGDIVHDGNVVRVWVKAVYSNEGRKKETDKVGGLIRNVTDSKALEEINCIYQNNWTAALVVYSMEKKVIISDFREQGIDFILPHSIFEELLKHCVIKG